MESPRCVIDQELALDDRDPICLRESAAIPGSRKGTSMDSWSETKSLIVIMTVIAIFYVLGRVVADALGVSL